MLRLMNWCTSKKNTFTVAHIVTIMIALRIWDIRDLIEIQFDDEVVEYFKKERSIMISGLTQDLMNVMEENSERLNKVKEPVS
ncbi:hypothetical protein Q75_01060 [Bacillus coahuilensis p1.1.43]|uniref:Uncharacterized protein n=1 Tax=Bacillus coahuilensis p1.1.43 TaxID=1150625 RepID=A0A147KCB2_9BACI|nr:hypothetical protein [Bacillus coahuilensis]KUP09251.1 hypothetical protein Q75_01060 [Bacillus coahuilensis p1.1.43]